MRTREDVIWAMLIMAFLGLVLPWIADAQTCDEVVIAQEKALVAADKAIEVQQKTINTAKEEIAVKDEVIDTCSKRVVELEENESDKYWWGAGGFNLGMLLMLLLL